MSEIMQDKYIVLQAINAEMGEKNFYIIDTKDTGLTETELCEYFSNLKKLNEKYYAGFLKSNSDDLQTLELYRGLRKKGIGVIIIHSYEIMPEPEKIEISKKIIEKAVRYFEALKKLENNV